MSHPSLSSNDCFPRINGYHISQRLYAGPRTLIYRGVRLADEQPVVLKLPREDHPSIHDLLRLRNHYTITQNLQISGIVQPLGLEPYSNGYVLVMPDDRDLVLLDYITDHPLNLAEFLAIAIQLTTILHNLHCQNVVHKDIKPSNVLIDPITQQVKLTDFGSATLLPHETQTILSAHGLEGSLAYMAPEQTGRMNRGIDYRCDFYTLGVTFYELLAGQLPFQAHDPLELVHCHIAQAAPRLDALTTQNSLQEGQSPAKLKIPSGIADIVAKLMAKNAEDRYQNALGLKYDLEIALRQLQSTGTIAPFDLAARDVSDRFLIPEKLYGREAEVQTLLNTFDRVSQGDTELVLVAGFSGIGKTAVVNEAHKPIVKRHGYFIKGKFDQFNCNIPFSAFFQAFGDLMGQLLSESDAQLQQWRSKILSALGENAQVMIEVIPELETIIGKQLPVPELSGSAAQNRFNLMFEKFIQVFTTQEQPLVIFLDDLQWVDSASLKLMQLLMNYSAASYLLLIGAYRDNEVSLVHPLMLTLEEITKRGARLETITLAPLQESDINHLIADTLSCTLELALPLTQLVYQKAKGNPFFNHQFLKALQEEGLVCFKPELGYWQCDIAQIKALALTDDVVEFMALQLQKLPPATQTVLKLAACIGNQFDLETLAMVDQQSPVETATHLWSALQAGLVLPQSEVYKFFQESKTEDDLLTHANFQVPRYRFLHDRVQQAAYSLIAEEDRQTIHFNIGQLLLSNTTLIEREERIFEIVSHLNIVHPLLAQSKDREEMVRLNLLAGRKAKSATAYSAAVNYLTTGISLLPEDAWERCYELTLTLHIEVAEAAYLNTDFDRMEQWVNLVLQQAKTLLDTIKVRQTQIMGTRAQGQFLNSLKIGLQVLKSLGVEFPDEPTQVDIDQTYEDNCQLWKGRSPLDLLDLPAMTDPYDLAAMEIMTEMVSFAYSAAPTFMPLLIFKQVALSIQSGNCQASVCAYADYGLILCGLKGDIASGYDFGQLALQLFDQLQAVSSKCRVWLIYSTFIHHWKAPLQDSLPRLKEAIQSGLATGELEPTGLVAATYCLYAYHAGQELTDLADEMESYRQIILQLKQAAPLYYHEIYQQTVYNLLRRSEIPYRLTGTVLDADKRLALLQAINQRSALFYFHVQQTTLSYLFGQYEQAAQHLICAKQYRDGAAGTFVFTLCAFYDSLIQLILYSGASAETQRQIIERVDKQQVKLQEWAILAPCNHQHRWELVEAERHRVLGDHLAAMEHYDRAIANAKVNGFIQDEALANELAAQFYLTWGKEKVAQTYMIEAYYCYVRWGATAKVNDLEQRYPKLLVPVLSIDRSINATTTPSVSYAGNNAKELDLDTLLKASQAISGEIELDKLLAILLNIVIANAGADKGAFLLQEEPGLQIVALVNSGQKPQILSSPTPLNFSEDVPIGLVNRAKHSLEPLVLADAHKKPQFASDRYIIQHQPKSILCIPILNQAQLLGILYLENNLTTGAFTRDRIELLNLLCTQAAISIANAQLYQTLQQSESKFRAFVENVNDIVYAITAEGTFNYLSPQFKDLLGYEVTDFLDQSFSELTHPDDRPTVNASNQRLFETGQKESGLELRAQHKNGDWVWLTCNNAPIFDDQGKVIGLRGIARDISDRKATEAALVESEAKFRRLVEGANDMIWSAQVDSTLTYLSPQFQTMFGFPPAEWVGKSFANLIHPDDLERAIAPAKFALDQGEKQQDVEFRHLCQDGSYLWVTVNMTPIQDAEGNSIGLQGIVRDISDRKATEAQLQAQAQQLAEYSQTLEQRVEERTIELSQALADLQSTQTELIQSEKMAALGQLTASVAHEINTPLGVIRGATHNIAAAFQASLQQLPPLLQRLSPQQQGDFLALVNAALQNHPSLSTREERQLRRQFQTDLTTQGIADADSIATQLTLLRLEPDLRPYQSILQDPNCLEILQVAYNLVLQQQSTSSIQQEVDRAAKIVFALKTYSHQSLTEDKSFADVTEAIEVALTLYQNRLNQGIEVIRQYQAGVPKILCNPDELTQVWVNLIDNAIYAMRHQGQIEISVTQADESVVVAITDSGCGIPAELQHRIFEPFFTTKPRGEGSGLGLDIVQQIVQKQGGTLQLHSEPGRTTFTVLLPILLNPP